MTAFDMPPSGWILGWGAAVGGFAMRQIISNVANGEITVVSGAVGQAIHVTLQAPSRDKYPEGPPKR